MKKARKPISLLLALVMALSLAATPAWAAGNVVQYTAGSSSSVAAKNVPAGDTMELKIGTNTGTNLYTVTATPASSGGIYLKGDTANVPDEATKDTSTSGRKTYWLGNNLTYVLKFSDTDAVSVKAYLAPTLTLGKTYKVTTENNDVTYRFTVGADKGGTYQFQNKDKQAVTTVHVYLCGATQKVEPDTTSGTYMLESGLTYAVRFPDRSTGSEFTLVRDATLTSSGKSYSYTYKTGSTATPPQGGTYNFIPTKTGLYTLTVNSTTTKGGVASAADNVLTVAISEAGKTSGAVNKIGSETKVNGKSQAVGRTLSTYALVAGTEYTVKATFNTGTDDGTTYKGSFTLLHDGNGVLNAAGNATLNPKTYPVNNTTTDKVEYQPVYFLFMPNASGWYRVSAGKAGELSLEGDSTDLESVEQATGRTQADWSSTKPESYTFTEGNLKDAGSCGLGMSAYFERSKLYLFKYEPAIEEANETAALADITPPGTGLAIKAVGDVSMTGVSATVTGMTPDSVKVIKFVPTADGELTLRVKTDKYEGTHTVLSGAEVYDKTGRKVTNDADVSLSATTNGTIKATFRQGETYYIAVKTLDKDSNYARSFTISVEQEDAAIVAPQAAGRKVTLVRPDKSETLEEDPANSGSYPLKELSVGTAYKVQANAAGYFGDSVTFTAGPTGNNPKLLLVAKPAVYAPGASDATIATDAAPSAGKVLNVTVTAKDVQPDAAAAGQYWVGINIPTTTDTSVEYYYGYGTYSNATGTKIKQYPSTNLSTFTDGAAYVAPTGASTVNIAVDPFRGGLAKPQNAWIKVAYGSDFAVVYQLNLQNVTKDAGGASETGDVEASVADATSAENTTAYKGDVGAAANQIVSTVEVGKNASPLTGAVNDLKKQKDALALGAFNILKGKNWFPNEKTTTVTNALNGECFTFFDDLVKNAETNSFDYVSQKGTLTAAGQKEVQKALNQVIVYPVLKVGFDYENENGSFTAPFDTFTLDIDAYTRALVTDTAGKTKIGTLSSYSGIITQVNPAKTKDRTNLNAVYTRADLMKLDTTASGNAEDKVDANEKIFAIQAVADKQIKVDRAIQLTVNVENLNNASTTGNSIYILHTHDSKTYKYEVVKVGSDDLTGSLSTDNKKLTFVSPHGLSKFKFVAGAEGAKTHNAAYIDRTVNGQTCRIWYDTHKDAIADAHHGETITIPKGLSVNITASNNNSASYLRFETGSGATITGAITINGSAVVMDADKQSGVWNGKAQGTDPNANDRVRIVAVTGATAKVTTPTLNPDEGETVRISVTAANGYANSGLTVTPASGSAPKVTTVSTSGSTTVYSFKMPAAKVTVTPVVTKTSTDTVTVKNANPNAGAVTVSSTKPAVGTTVTVTVTPKANYKLNKLTAYNTTSQRNVILTKLSDTKYTFKMQSGGVTVSPTWASGNSVSIVETGGGTVTASDVNAKPGASVVLTPDAAGGYMLTSIQVRGAGDDAPVTTVKSGDKYYFTMPASGGVTVTPTWRLSAAPAPYTDAIAEWAKNYVEYAYRRNLMTGTTATTFGGANTVTRGEIWTILARYDGFYPKSNVTSPWYNEARAWAMNKVTPGGSGYVSDGTNGGSVVTREQLATMLWRYAGSPASNQSLAAFPDANKIHSSWPGFEPAMRWAVEKGILSGKTVGSSKTLYLDPTGNATRNEVAKMISQFVLSA